MLYKISRSLKGGIFYPTKFWRTEDWKSSSTNPKPDYILDHVLYAGEFDVVSIHILPEIRRIRVILGTYTRRKLRKLGVDNFYRKVIIFVTSEHKEKVDSFRPTIHKFERDGFELVPSNEYIAREPKKAVEAETISMSEAISRWDIQLYYVDDLQIFKELLKDENIEFIEQT